MTNRPPSRPEDLFRQEKERALTVRNSQHARLLAEAKAAFDKLMAEGQAARKSGRPRKHPLPPLKTTSSRTPLPPAKSAPPAPIAKAAAPAPIKPAPVKAAKPEVRAAAKHTEPAKKAAKPASRSAHSATSKSKPKAKRSARR